MFDFNDAGGGGFGPSDFDKIDRQDDTQTQQQRIVVRIDYDLCENTAVCSDVCPEDVFESGDGHPSIVKPEACTECWICVENCTAGAIEIG